MKMSTQKAEAQNSASNPAEMNALHAMNGAPVLIAAENDIVMSLRQSRRGPDAISNARTGRDHVLH
jgi:hypothetical protein